MDEKTKQEQSPLIQLLADKFGLQSVQIERYGNDTPAVSVPKSILLDVIKFLREDERCAFEQLTDIVGIDYKGYPGEVTARFALSYLLLSHSLEHRMVIKVWASADDMVVPSIVSVYNGANWPEREAAEMFGFQFDGHPDLRRLLLCDLFEGKNPLRKDYPLKGQGERDSFRMVTRETV